MGQREDWHITDRITHEDGEGDPFAAAVRATRMPMVITDPRQPDNPIVFCNQAFQQLTGYHRHEIIGRNCRFLQGPDTDPEAVRRLRQAVAGQTDIDVDLLNYRKDGSTFWNALYLSPVRSAAGEVQFFFASQLNVSDRVEAQIAIERQKAEVEREVARRTADLQEALEAKTLLLHEVDHRVKNNLTMIGSLLRLQARQIDDPAIADKLEVMLERVDALATVHRRLYQSDDISRFDISAFAVNLVSDVIGASGRGDIAVMADTTKIEIPSRDAAALGLVLNEVLTNSIKHGFRDGRSGTLRITTRVIDGRAELIVADDGPGMIDGASSTGLGRTLIKRLSRQVKAEARWRAADPGTEVVISFPVDIDQ
ncbi:histidine kinase [Sphingomonas sp. Leaf357]|uniref:histidine kinase dimerization/phosphoacceptor domain -containing protein n=1 Tax=Sphingomonas sp. Leaf357 TaxID=1736350 RepID=UPI0006F40AF7|nr:histidine kinase dimerization/phosphoacceptor domain -containing protein [Sphingomonas sp. Leaf357]KQS03479.1 histidine kinase [Sphingomonas sp. Leaf357]